MSGSGATRCKTCGSPLPKGGCRRCDGELARPELLGPSRRLTFVGAFFLGLRFALRGAIMTLTRPKLLALWVLPMLVNVGVFVGLILLAFENKELMPSFDSEWPWYIEWARGILASTAGFLFGALAVIASALSALLLSSVIAAPFLEWISESVESIVLGTRDRRPINPHYVWNIWIVPLCQAAFVAVLQGVVMAALLVGSLTGVLAPLLFLGAAWMASVTLTDIVIARKRYPITARFVLPTKNASLWFGLALPFAFAPYLVSLGVAGATLAYLRELRLGPR